MDKQEIIDKILAERSRQDAKWGRDIKDWNASSLLKLTILAEEFGEVARAVLEKDLDNLEEELIQVAAFSMAWLESKGESWR